MAGTHLIGVYGTLKESYGNHRLLATSKKVGSFRTEPKYRLYSLGGFPGLKIEEDRGERVHVEVYEVNDATLERLDGLEGHPNWYRRIPLDIVGMPAEYAGRTVEGYLYQPPVNPHADIGNFWPGGKGPKDDEVAPTVTAISAA